MCLSHISNKAGLWKKLMRTIPIIRSLSKPLMSMQSQIETARQNLLDAQRNVTQDRFNADFLLL